MLPAANRHKARSTRSGDVVSSLPSARPARRRSLPVVDEPKSSLATDGRRRFIYPADVTGRFATARKAVFLLLIAIYAALPWITIGGHPALFLNVERREFYLFGGVFNAQDMWMTVFLFTGAAFGLVVVTATLGRVWCGWACPQTVFLDGVFRRIERIVEGPHDKRRRRDDGPWSLDKLWRKIVMHALFLGTSFLLAHVLLAYFVSVRSVLSFVVHRPSEHVEVFIGVSALTLVLYFNFAWFREQFCVVLCPYGRLQSALFDSDSLIVGYDVGRGEPRGKTKKENAGDCVDCLRCVAVCPTGIDIRNGLQMDCIACTACIDACDEIMDRLGRERGLIRYDSQNGLAGEPRKFWRPRMFVYAALGTLGILAASFAFSQRNAFDANLLRSVGAPYEVDGPVVRDAFHLHIVNKHSRVTTFTVEPRVAPNAEFLVPIRTVTLPPLGSADVPVFVTVQRASFRAEFPVRIAVVPNVGSAVEVTAAFLGPEKP